MNHNRHTASIGVAVHAVASAALFLLTATDYWQAPFWIWFFLSVWLAAAVNHESASARLRGLAGSLGWGLSWAWIGILCAERRFPPPIGYDDTWHILVVGWPFQRVTRLWQDPTGLVDIWGPRRFGYERLFEWDASFVWFAVNVTVCCAIAQLGRLLPRLWLSRWLSFFGILVGTVVSMFGAHFLHWTHPLVVR